MEPAKSETVRDAAVEDAVLAIFERHGLRASVLEPAIRNDRFFGNVIDKWSVGSLVISVVSDRGQWFAAISMSKAREQSFEMSDIASLLGLERLSSYPPQSMHPLITQIAANFTAIEDLFSKARIEQTKRELKGIVARRDAEFKNRLDAIAAQAKPPNTDRTRAMNLRDLLIVCGGVALVAALWFWYGVVGTITIIGPGAEILARPVPIEFDPSNSVLANLQPGDRLDVYDRVYGKDYLMYEVRLDGRMAYVQYNSSYLRFDPSWRTSCVQSKQFDPC